MSNFERTSKPRGRWPIIGGFALLGVIVIAAAAVAAWQASVQQSNEDKVESHSTTVALLQNVGEEGGIAATLIQQYVANGDDTLIPEIQSHTAAATESLTGAAAQSDAAGMDEIVANAVGLVGGAGQIIALRQSGDVEGAATALVEVAPAFQELNLALAEVADQELQQAADLQDRADRASGLSQWSLIVSAAAGATLGLAFLALIGRSFISRRVSKPAVPI